MRVSQILDKERFSHTSVILRKRFKDYENERRAEQA